LKEARVDVMKFRQAGVYKAIAFLRPHFQWMNLDLVAAGGGVAPPAKR